MRLNATKTGMEVLLNRSPLAWADLSENGTSYTGVDLRLTSKGAVVATFDVEFGIEVSTLHHGFLFKFITVPFF